MNHRWHFAPTGEKKLLIAEPVPVVRFPGDLIEKRADA